VLCVINKLLIITCCVVLTNSYSERLIIENENKIISRDWDSFIINKVTNFMVFKYRYKFTVKYHFFKELNHLQSFAKSYTFLFNLLLFLISVLSSTSRNAVIFATKAFSGCFVICDKLDESFETRCCFSDTQ